MPNLVGIGLSQVPTNSMLGGMAYQDPEHASIKNLDLKNLSQINSEIADTAVDVFVYDTRKDSDGGAWRKRTQNTSWYNETLNTATRGSRKDFPAVAVIVAEGTKVTIYDGDDPDLPMWMVFNVGGTAWASNNLLAQSGASTTWSIAALNGTLVLGPVVAYRMRVINFVSEYVYVTSQAGGKTYNGSISERNIGKGYTDDSSIGTTIDGVFNDVAMTVLPNAPVDPSTGLPIPTIAVAVGSAGAANGGVSVIKDDGTVVDIVASTGAGGYASYNIEFGNNNELIHTQTYDHYYASVNIFDTIPSSDISASNTYTAARSYPYINSVPDIRGPRASGAARPSLYYLTNSSGGDIAFGFKFDDAKLSLLSDNKNAGTDATKSMVAYITSDYNTGWMHGNCKGAFLSDTDTTNVTGTELITNPGPNFSDTSGWGATNGTLSISSGDLLLTGANNVNEHMYSSGFTLTSGETYVLFVDSNQLFSYLRIGTTTALGTGEQLDTNAGSGLNSYTFTATASGIFYLKLGMVTSYVTGSINSVSLRLAEEDRSVNNNGLQVFGTITKTPVATGADLVGYSGFSASNYLQQPYNSDLNYGTGTYYFMYWLNSPVDGSDRSVFCQGDYATAKGMYTLAHNSSGTGNQLLVGDGGGTVVIQNHENQGWVQICLVRSNGTLFGYRNGVLQGTASSTQNITSVNTSVVFGAMVNNGNIGFIYQGKLSLFRTGASAPSAEQIKKIYEDEKVLFQENAKATLYGSSDAVTALAYDDTTNLLHVGTSAGRSEFQGLRRINNTTDAVTTAISASNGLVAEQ